jgi:hypothetical protein
VLYPVVSRLATPGGDAGGLQDPGAGEAQRARFGLWDRLSPVTAIATIPIAVWEFSLGVYLIVKGFKPSPVTTGMVAITPSRAAQDTDNGGHVQWRVVSGANVDNDR